MSFPGSGVAACFSFDCWIRLDTSGRYARAEDTARVRVSTRASGDVESFMSSFNMNCCLRWIGLVVGLCSSPPLMIDVRRSTCLSFLQTIKWDCAPR